MSSLRRPLAIVGIAGALAAAGPVASAMAASFDPITGGAFPFPSLFGPGPAQAPGTCGPDQGMFPGFLNLGPTGPLGPLGPYGPLGPGHLPCGISIFDLGPTGPLGPGGQLGPHGGF